MVAITYRTLGPWGAGKGANLQPSEVDANFYALAEAIVDIQNNPEAPNGIESIAVSGTQMTIYLTNGDVMGPFTLPVLTFRWRGEFDPTTPYAVLDVFTVDSGTAAVDEATVRYGIFMVQIAGTYPTFDPDESVDGAPVYLQLFGSVETLLRTLGDVEIDSPDGIPTNGSVLIWNDESQKWLEHSLGDMAFQYSGSVNIVGGNITGMSAPVFPQDVVNKAYVDALPAGMTAPPGTIMANILPGAPAPALPNTLSDILDFTLGAATRGTLLFRGAPGWIAFPPGTDGLFLQTHGAGADPTWQIGASGVVTIHAGTGINTGGADITSTGTVSLAAIADNNLLANASGVSAAPVPTTLSAMLDHVASSVRGSVLMRAGGGWVALAPGTSGYFLKTQGTGADVMWDAPAGSGTVTSVAAGTGLTTGGGPITGAGTISFATTADSSLLANISGSTAAPAATTLSLLLDHVLGTTQGSFLYRSASAWVQLTPGTSGQILTTGGSGANPSWANAPASPAIGSHLILANITGASAVPIGNTLSNIFDAVISSTRGTLVFRSGVGWVALAPGTAGQVLTTGGSGADPAWAPGGSTISVGDTPPASPTPGTGWWDSADGQLYIRYDDGNSAQWVPASNQPGSPGPTGATGAAGPAGPTGATGPAGPIGNVVAGTGLSGGGSTSTVTVSLATPVSIANGGTNATTAPAALTALGAAPIASPALTGNPTAPTPAAGDNDTSIATTAFVQTAAAPAFNDVGRNLVHNALYAVQQRGAGPWTVPAFTADRWGMYFVNGSQSTSIVALTDANRAAIGDEGATYGLQCVVAGSATAGSTSQLYHNVEGVRRLAGKTVTASFWSWAAAGTPRIGVSPYQSFGTGGSPSAAVNVAAQTVTISTTPTRYSLSFVMPSISGKTLGTNNNDFTNLTFVFSDPAATVGVQSGTFTLWGVQLEIGSTATPLEKPDPRYDLANCLRFYQSSAFTWGAWAGSSGCYGHIPLLQAMRALPNSTLSNLSYGGGASAATISSVTLSGIRIVYTTTIGSNTTVDGLFTASADL